jgi:hypothetical protein
MALMLAFATSGVFTEMSGCYKTEYSQDENRFDEEREKFCYHCDYFVDSVIAVSVRPGTL